MGPENVSPEHDESLQERAWKVMFVPADDTLLHCNVVQFTE